MVLVFVDKRQPMVKMFRVKRISWHTGPEN